MGSGQAGSGDRWGPLFGQGAADWAATWEGPDGWGTPVYDYVLERSSIGGGGRVLDCGCGAGRFLRMAADRGAEVAGLDAAEELIEISRRRTPEGDFHLGDLETLPWDDDSFDVVTGFSSFQFADNKERAFREAARVSRGSVVVVIPSRVGDSGVTHVFQPLFPLFDEESLEAMRDSGMFALSGPGRLDDELGAAGLSIIDDVEVPCPIVFADLDSGLRAFVGAGPTALAVAHSGENAVIEAAREGLASFTQPDGSVAMPGWYRTVTVTRQ